MTSDSIGRQAEETAALYLESKGYTILEKRFRIRGGEIDLVAMEEGVLVFVEVKYRKTRLYGRPEDFVDQKKKQKILRAAMFYTAEKKLTDVPMRFDVVAIWEEEGKKKAHLYRNAFEGGYGGGRYSYQ